MTTVRGDVALRQGEHDGHAWAMALRRPDPSLDGIVAGPYCDYEESGREVRRRQTATDRVPVIISFGDPIDLVELSASGSPARRVTSFVAGLHDGYVVTRFAGTQHGVQVDLTPLGAARVLGPPHELANECVDLDLVLGRFGAELTERLATAPGWPERFDLLDEVLIARAADGPDPDPAVVWAWRQLRRSHGQVAVGVLADEVGWSRRHFTVRFREQVGLPPKPAARVLRFRRAAGLLAAHPDRSITDVAAACGYADHSHLVREFRRLAGCTPSAYVRALLPGGAGVGG